MRFLVEGRPVRDLTGQKFGRLTAIKPVDRTKDGKVKWLCQCDCGNTSVVDGRDLTHGKRISCGCIRTEKNPQLGHDAITALWKRNKPYNTHLGIISKTTPRKDSRSGIRGVSWDEARQKWVMQLMLGGKLVAHSYFKNLEDAIKARKQAEAEYFEPVLDRAKNNGDLK